MYIRRKVFSLLQDETGEERYFSTTDFEISGDAEERIFSKKNKKKRERVDLEDVESHRGLGRSLLIGGLPGAVGAYTGKDAANKAAKEGKSDEEVVKAASKRGRNVGAALGAAGTLAAIPSLKYLPKKKAIALGALAAAGNVGAGALAGHLGAKKNTEDRLKKSRKRG